MPKVFRATLRVASLSMFVDIFSQQLTTQAEISNDNGGTLALVANSEDYE